MEGQEEKKRNGGVNARVGHSFKKQVEEIINERLKTGKSKDKVSLEKISNLIVNNQYWEEMKKDIINATEEQIKKHGLK